MAQTQSVTPDIVVVRVEETITKVTLVITRGEGKQEAVEFDSGLSTSKSLRSAGEGYYKVFQKIYQEGTLCKAPSRGWMAGQPWYLRGCRSRNQG